MISLRGCVARVPHLRTWTMTTSSPRHDLTAPRHDLIARVCCTGALKEGAFGDCRAQKCGGGRGGLRMQSYRFVSLLTDSSAHHGHSLIARVCYAGALEQGIKNGRSLDLERRCGVVARVCCAGFLLANTRALPHRLRLRMQLRQRNLCIYACFANARHSLTGCVRECN